jgi:hypothetical protein
VTFTLNRINGNVSDVKLYEQVSTIDNSGTATSVAAETQLQSWNSPAFPVTFTTSAGYGTNKLVQYRFEVSGNGHTYTHRVTFATSPYPVANAAIPVYTVGDINKVLNVVFIPDEDMQSDMTKFYTHVGRDIDSSFHNEDWIRRFRSSYNFFVNPVTGKAGDFNAGTAHVYPTNDAQLSFAQGRIILHSANKRDFSDGNYVGTEYYNRGTILHETGHLLYGMADEYDGGSHWENEDLPNNWPTQTKAEAYAPGCGKTNADVKKMGGDDWYRICIDDCMMLQTGLHVHPYDVPCQDRILWRILQRANGN